MKKIIATSLMIAALAVVSPTYATETVTCQAGQYGGAVCGVSTSTETRVERTAIAGTGIADWTLAQIIAFAGVSAVAATLLYKATYRYYLLG